VQNSILLSGATLREEFRSLALFDVCPSAWARDVSIWSQTRFTHLELIALREEYPVMGADSMAARARGKKRDARQE